MQIRGSDVVRLEFMKDPLAALRVCLTGCEGHRLGTQDRGCCSRLGKQSPWLGPGGGAGSEKFKSGWVESQLIAYV